MNKGNFRKTSKSRREMRTKDHEIFKALRNPFHTTSVIDENGIKRLVYPYEFISLLHRSIKKHKKHPSVENAEKMIACYDMPAIQRCLQMVLMINRTKTFDKSDLHKYIARKFEHITLEMLEKDYQTDEASKFKERYDKLLDLGSK